MVDEIDELLEDVEKIRNNPTEDGEKQEEKQPQTEEREVEQAEESEAERGGKVAETKTPVGSEEWLEEISEEGEGEKFEFEVEEEEEEKPELTNKSAKETAKNLISFSKSRIKGNMKKTLVFLFAVGFTVALYATGQMLLLMAMGAFTISGIYCYFFWKGILTADMTALVDFDFENAKTKLLMVGNEKAEEEFDLNVRSFHHDQFATRVVFTEEIDQEKKEIKPTYCHGIDTLTLRENEIALENSRKVAETKIEENARLARNRDLEVEKSIDSIRKTLRKDPRDLTGMELSDILKWTAHSRKEKQPEEEKMEVESHAPRQR